MRARRKEMDKMKEQIHEWSKCDAELLLREHKELK
jgi:hypothetical protein